MLKFATNSNTAKRRENRTKNKRSSKWTTELLLRWARLSLRQQCGDRQESQRKSNFAEDNNQSTSRSETTDQKSFGTWKLRLPNRRLKPILGLRKPLVLRMIRDSSLGIFPGRIIAVKDLNHWIFLMRKRLWTSLVLHRSYRSSSLVWCSCQQAKGRNQQKSPRAKSFQAFK